MRIKRTIFPWAGLVLILQVFTVSAIAGEMNAQDYYQVGFDKRQHKDYDEAIAALTKAIALDPQNELYIEQRSAAEGQKGDLKAAIKDLDVATDVMKAQQHTPMLPYYYEDRGSLKVLAGDFKGAIDDYTLALVPVKPPKLGAPLAQIFPVPFAPVSVGPLYFRAIAKELTGDFDGAITDLQKYISTPPLPETGINMGRERESTDEMIHHVAYADLWVLLMKAGKQHDADDQLATYIKQYPTQPTVFFEILKLLLDKTPEPPIDLDRIDSGGFGTHLYFSGMKRLFDGDKATAISYFKKCVALNRMDPSYLPEYYVIAAPSTCHTILCEAELKTLEK